MDLMVANFNTAATPSPPLGLTENGSATYLSTGNPCLDLFFKAVPSTPPTSLTALLSTSWAHNPLTTLKLICNLRGVRGTGKSDKTSFYTAALWLHTHHPKTLACNLRSFAEFGYFKDFPEILFRILGLSRAGKTPKRKDKTSTRGPFHVQKNKTMKMKKKKMNEVSVRGDALRQEKESVVAAGLRREKRDELARKALERYGRDPEYRFLHDRVADLFAEFLIEDMVHFREGRGNMISLAAKWCPSLDSSFDRGTLLCEAVARRVFPKEGSDEYRGIEEGHYAYRVRDRLRREVLVPLRKVLELPEVFMSKREWGEVRYNRVASVAMKTYKDIFMKRDEERFKEFLDRVKEGKAKIAAGALLPHEIVAAVLKGGSDGGEVAELQWKRMVADLLEIGKLTDCIAVCDVSGSMDGTPMEVCIALGLLLSELSEAPWKGKVITFSKNPQLHVIQGNDLISKTSFIRRMDWGMNTDFQKVFDLILQVAVHGKLAAEQMIKRVFVFSDMEFDQASSTPWETDYKVIRRKFEEKGYGNCVPEIVFWNLRDSRSTPVPTDQKGVALVSGFSKNMMKLFLEGKELLDPEGVMEAAISGEEYSKLVVLD